MRRFALIFALVAAVGSAQESPFGNKLGPFVPSPSKVVDLMLDVARVHPGDVLYDLGAGDGRIVIAAAQRHVQAVGIELNPTLVATAKTDISQLGLNDRAKVIQGDVLTADFGDATVVTIYMDTSSNAKLRPRLEKLLKPGTRVVSHDYEIPGWRPSKVVKTEDGHHMHTIYLYELPAQKQK